MMATKTTKKLYDDTNVFGPASASAETVPTATPSDKVGIGNTNLNNQADAAQSAAEAGYKASLGQYEAKLGLSGAAGQGDLDKAYGEYDAPAGTYADFMEHGLGDDINAMLNGGAFADAQNVASSGRSQVASGLSGQGLGLNAGLSASLGLRGGFAGAGARQRSMRDLAGVNADYRLKGAAGSTGIADKRSAIDQTVDYETQLDRLGDMAPPTFAPASVPTGTVGPDGTVTTSGAAGGGPATPYNPQDYEDILKKYGISNHGGYRH